MIVLSQIFQNNLQMHQKIEFFFSYKCEPLWIYNIENTIKTPLEFVDHDFIKNYHLDIKSKFYHEFKNKWVIHNNESDEVNWLSFKVISDFTLPNNIIDQLKNLDRKFQSTFDE